MNYISASCINNLNIFQNTPESKLQQNYWVIVSTWMLDVITDFKLKNETYINALHLFADYYSDSQVVRNEIQLTSIACMYISSMLIDIDIADESDFIYISDYGYAHEQLKLRTYDIINKTCGILRPINAIDIYNQLIYDNNDKDNNIYFASKIAILLCMRSSKYLSIDAKNFASACLTSVKRVRGYDVGELTNIESDIYDTIKKIPKEYLFRYRESDISKILDLYRKSTYETCDNMDIEMHEATRRKIHSNIKNYTELNCIGDGTWGNVVLCSRDNKKFAMKKQDFNKSAIREIAILSTYKHPNIISMGNFQIMRDKVKIELELGESLHDLIFDKRSTESWKNVYIHRNVTIPLLGSSVTVPLSHNRRKLMNDIIAGVKYLHSVGILHLDLKIDNIVVVDGTAKIIDFGLSKLMILTKNDNSIKDSQIVTVNYRPPELLLLENGQSKKIIEKRYDNRRYSYGVDIWSVGAILLTMEMGVIAFSHGRGCKMYSFESKVLKHITKLLGTPKNIEDYPYNFPGTGLKMVKDNELRNQILHMLDYDPSKRYM